MIAMTKIRPINPDKLIIEKAKAIPDQVIRAFNELITRGWNGQRAIVYTADVLDFISVLTEVSKVDIVQNHWLDIEQIYMDSGYNVTYYKPKYGESFPSYFEFEKNTLGSNNG